MLWRRRVGLLWLLSTLPLLLLLLPRKTRKMRLQLLLPRSGGWCCGKSGEGKGRRGEGGEEEGER